MLKALLECGANIDGSECGGPDAKLVRHQYCRVPPFLLRSARVGFLLYPLIFTRSHRVATGRRVKCQYFYGFHRQKMVVINVCRKNLVLDSLWSKYRRSKPGPKLFYKPGGNTVRHGDKRLKRYYQNYSPLLMACFSKQKEVVKLLLFRKCDVNMWYSTNAVEKDEYRKYDALHAACRSKSNKEIIDLLMNEKKDWKYDHLTEELDCDKDMIAYVKSKRPKVDD